jgi:hypothetical protein
MFAARQPSAGLADGNRADSPFATELTRLPTELALAVLDHDDAEAAAHRPRLRGKARWMMITAWVVPFLV